MGKRKPLRGRPITSCSIARGSIAEHILAERELEKMAHVHSTIHTLAELQIGFPRNTRNLPQSSVKLSF